MFDFNTPKEVGLSENYFLNLKSQQYYEQTSNTIFHKLYSIIENDKVNQEICIQIIEELLKAKECFIKDIETETSIEYVLKMENSHYSTEILKLLVFYWDIEENPQQFENYKEILAQKSPICELILNLKEGTKHNFQVLFAHYLDNMKKQYKEYPNLHQKLLQKDRKYLLKHKTFSIKYRSFANKFYIISEIPENPKLLDMHDDFIFTMLSTEQQRIKDIIMNLTNTKEFDKILRTIDYQEVLNILFARSPKTSENLLEQMLSKPNNIVNDLLQNLCITYEIETFYTEKMLFMVIIRIYTQN